VGTLELTAPFIAASGVWPYDPRFWRGDFTSGLGAACTKAISRTPRPGNSGLRLWETPSGLLNSIGLQNEGVEGFLKRLGPIAWGERDGEGIPVIANVVMETPEETQGTLDALRKVSGHLAAVELNISCPNADREGMAWGISPESAAEAARIAREVWKERLWVKMTPQTGDPEGVARALEQAGADVLVAGNTWLGMAMNLDTQKPVFERIFAGLSGPGIFPLALRWVWQVSHAVSIPVVGCGGVFDGSGAASMLLAGASAVELGTALFRNPNAPAEISAELKEYLQGKGQTLSDLAKQCQQLKQKP
jgi:dihydroorotate dehydrogenase (NAD+) catalytic subunit